MNELANRASRLLGDDLVGFEALTGGQLSSVLRISLVSGGSAVVKSGGSSQIEADMLQAIRTSGAPTPKVLAADADVLILEDLGKDTGLSGAWASLGSAVRTLHASAGPRYGWPVDYRRRGECLFVRVGVEHSVAFAIAERIVDRLAFGVVFISARDFGLDSCRHDFLVASISDFAPSYL